MLQDISGIGELVRTVLVVVVFPFVVKWLNERRKGDLAKRIALIAADIAGSIYAANPNWDEAQMVQEIARALASQFPDLPAPVVDRVAASALAAAKCKS